MKMRHYEIENVFRGVNVKTTVKKRILQYMLLFTRRYVTLFNAT